MVASSTALAEQLQIGGTTGDGSVGDGSGSETLAAAAHESLPGHIAGQQAVGNI